MEPGPLVDDKGLGQPAGPVLYQTLQQQQQHLHCPPDIYTAPPVLPFDTLISAPALPSTPALSSSTPALPSSTPALSSSTPALPSSTPTLSSSTPALPSGHPALPSFTPALPSFTPAPAPLVSDTLGLGPVRAMIPSKEECKDQEEESEFKTVAGHVLLSTWQLQPDLALQYAIRFDSATPEPGSHVDVSDVFVSLDQAIRLLTSVSGQTLKVKPPNIKTIWTINLGSSDLDFCPLSEFVYHAALKASGKRFRKVYEGILQGLVTHLCSLDGVASRPELQSYTQKNYWVNDYGDGFGGKAREGRGEQEQGQEQGQEEQLDWQEMEERITEEGAKLEVKQEVEFEEEQEEEMPVKRVKVKTAVKQHDCDLCGESFKSALRLQRHKREEHREAHPSLGGGEEEDMQEEELMELQEGGQRVPGSHNCTVCGKSFVRILILLNHCRREHPERPEAWPREPVRLGLLDTLHERRPSLEDGLYSCSLDLCSVRLERFLSMVDHERTHTEAFICILCGVCCNSAENLIGHMDSRHEDKSEFVCRVCGFFNRKADTLRTHVQQEHMAGAVLFQCEQCPYTTEKKQSLHCHKRTAHSEQTDHFCDICGKSYASGASLYVHKRSHDPDFKKFQCKLCPTKFAYSSGLSYHMAVHTGEKPFKCDQCGSTFGSHTALSRHVKVLHAEEKDMVFQCEHCGKKFPKRMQLEYKNHVKIHTGERDHVCTICGSSYFSRKILRKHELKKHPHLLPKRTEKVRIDPESVPQLTVTQKAPNCTYS